jgi:hypothetical protein
VGEPPPPPPPPPLVSGSLRLSGTLGCCDFVTSGLIVIIYQTTFEKPRV